MEGCTCMEVWIKAVVVEQVLKVLGLPSGNVLECINFGSVYFGSSKIKQISLHNDSPECMDWVAVLEDNAAGGEMVRKGKKKYIYIKLKTYFCFCIFVFPHSSSNCSYDVVLYPV